MNELLVISDNELYEPKEAAVMVVALAWVIMLGSSVVAAIILCGWKGAKSVAMDWIHMKATFTCR